MDFIRRLFGGGARPMANRSAVLYVRPRMCQEVLAVRLDMMNGPSLMDDGKGYYMRKLARGIRCPFEVEIELTFDRNKALVSQTIQNGEFVTEADYEAFMAANPQG